MIINDLIKHLKREKKEKKPKHPVRFRQKFLRLVIHLFAWLGIAVLYYFVFSSFFDTPVEYRMRQSISTLEKEYELLSARYDTIETILDNLVDRDANIFRALYDSDPVNFDEREYRLERYDSLIRMNNGLLTRSYTGGLARLERQAGELSEAMDSALVRTMEIGTAMNSIPSIQPIINPDLNLIATSFGMKIHPFYKTMVQHNGIDYAVPEGTRVFATADGTVSSLRGGRTNTGTTVIIDHGNGYQTRYHHLSRITVREGIRVKRGDIIALTGNSGLSLAPHLHYEIHYRGEPVDPIHYFFNELGPADYEKAKRLASVGMQALD